jgi:hypothetical protein
VLKVNYRHTVQILGLARRVAEEVVGAPGVVADDKDPVPVPEDAGWHGVEPKVRRCVSFEAVVHAVGEWLVGRRKAGYEWGRRRALSGALDRGEVCKSGEEARGASGAAWGRRSKFFRPIRKIRSSCRSWRDESRGRRSPNAIWELGGDACAQGRAHRNCMSKATSRYYGSASAVNDWTPHQTSLAGSCLGAWDYEKDEA